MRVEDRFGPATKTGQKIKCLICGATGWDVGVGGRLHTWMDTHLREHLPCPRCGKQVVTLLNGKARTHGRCPNRETTTDRH